MPVEAMVLVACSGTALTLISGVAWLVNRRQQRGRRRQRTWSLTAVRRWATSRQAVGALGGLVIAILACWWSAEWLRHETPPGEDVIGLVQSANGEGGGEVVAFDAAIDPAARQKMLAQRWRHGLPLLAAIGLAVAAWVGVAHSGLLDQHHRRKGSKARAQVRT